MFLIPSQHPQHTIYSCRFCNLLYGSGGSPILRSKSLCLVLKHMLTWEEPSFTSAVSTPLLPPHLLNSQGLANILALDQVPQQLSLGYRTPVLKSQVSIADNQNLAFKSQRKVIDRVTKALLFLKSLPSGEWRKVAGTFPWNTLTFSNYPFYSMDNQPHIIIIQSEVLAVNDICIHIVPFKRSFSSKPPPQII